MNREKFVAELWKLRPAATFLSVMGYCNEYSEVADYSIVFHMKYQSAVQRSLAMLEEIVPNDTMESLAKQELIDSLQASLKRMEYIPEEELQPWFMHFKDDNGSYIKGIKLHIETCTLHLYGLVNHKRILMPGSYPQTNSSILTVVKDRLRSRLPVGKFRSFRMKPNQVNHISVESLTLLPPSD